MSNKDTKYTNARIILLSEYLFIFLPFIVIAIVKIYNSKIDEFLRAPDWSFASSILFGQLLVKFGKRPGKYTLKWLKGDEKMIGLADFGRELGDHARRHAGTSEPALSKGL